YFVTQTPSPGTAAYNIPATVGPKKSYNTGGNFAHHPRDTLEWAFHKV
ncbi:MAG: hypothetical protein EZS28_015757, partial [Streblomastix strix]